MNDRENKTDLGTVRIQNDVLRSIACLAAKEVNGVIRVGLGFKNNLKQFLMNKSVPIRPVKVIVENNNEVKIYVSIVVTYGSNIAQVAADVQDNIKRNIEKMTGLTVSDVDVDIQGVVAGETKGEEKNETA